MKKNFYHKSVFRFRQFACKAYSVFCSLHREVTIGTVKLFVADKEMLKAGRSVALMLLLLTAIPAIGEEDDSYSPPSGGSNPALLEGGGLSESSAAIHRQLSLQEVQVVANKAEVTSLSYRLVSVVTHDQIAALPVQTVADVLRFFPGLDVRTRGANGAQADISMHGGTFDQVLVMINGVNLTDAQTGHYSLNLPVSVDLIERIEVLQGTSAHLFGLNAFAGAINIITKAPQDSSPSTSLRLTAGMNGLVNPAVATRQRGDKWYVNASAEYTRADGYYAPSPTEKEQKSLDNSDLRLANIYLQTGYKGLDVQVGAQYKDAGAGMFYGFGSQDQFDATRTAFAAARYTHQWGAWGLEAAASYRANYDRYEWHRGQRLYGNFHFAQNSAASLKGSFASQIGKTTIGLELRNENIHSTNLGDTVNPAGQVPNVPDFPLSQVRVLDLVKGKNRLNINYFAEQSFVWRDLSAGLGVSGNWNNMFGNNISGCANIGYSYARNSSVFINANRSLRLPTFTDLYYNAGNQLGNPLLKPEKAWTLSIGTKYEKNFGKEGFLLVSGHAYYRWGRDIIDWVYTPDDTKRPYHAQNHNRVGATGVEASVAYRMNKWLRTAEVNYAYTWLDLDVDKSGSRYLDYLSHKLVARIEHGIYYLPHSMFGASWSLTWQKREGQYNDADGNVRSFSPVLLLDGQLYWEHPFVKVAVDCTNMTNRHYYDYGGVLQPGAWAKLTISVKLATLARDLKG